VNTCGGCITTWTGMVMCHCAGCHNTFSSLGLFDRHRRGGRCREPGSCVLGKDATPAMRQDARGVWVGAEANPRWSKKEANA
jgi:hypothetical protein